MRVAVVTGATDGIGKETATSLLQQDIIVYLTGRSESKLLALREKFDSANVIPFVLDVKNDEHIEDLYQRICSNHGRVDILINNAAIYVDNYMEGKISFEQTAASFLDTLDVNLIGSYRTIQKFLPLMIMQNYGRIVNVSSGMGRFYEINDKGMFYQISKLGLNSLTYAVAKSVMPYNILVNSVCPGWVKTNMGGKHAVRSVAQAADGIIWAATLPDGGPNGKFFRDRQALDFCRKTISLEQTQSDKSFQT